MVEANLNKRTSKLLRAKQVQYKYSRIVKCKTVLSLSYIGIHSLALETRKDALGLGNLVPNGRRKHARPAHSLASGAGEGVRARPACLGHVQHPCIVGCAFLGTYGWVRVMRRVGDRIGERVV